MLFNSFQFILLFLPLCLAVYFAAARIGPSLQVLVLAVASLIFYCGWDFHYLPLLAASIAFNFTIGKWIVARRLAGFATLAQLTFGVVINLLVLGYYKYALFLVATANDLGAGLPLWLQTLPLGISFFTFTQLAFLVDAHRGKTDDPKILEYVTFVAYFPHLIAGPIIHHHETIPQFRRPRLVSAAWLAPGLAMFTIGLAKKILIADTFGSVGRPVFDGFNTSSGTLTGVDAWVGALSYTFQLYFDFSAYSDMAIGLSLMLGIYIPINFDSPYKATNIIDFWRRWHMTLSRYLRDYLYIPLGGNRLGPARRYLNLMLTMLLGGLWHGAGWTFVIWGGLHGLYLVINHAWQRIAGINEPSITRRWAGRLITFLCVAVAWVFFKAETVPAALNMLTAMISPGWQLSHEVSNMIMTILVPASITDAGLSVGPHRAVFVLLMVGFAIAWFCPNSQELVFKTMPWWRYPLDEAPAATGWRAQWWLSPLAAICAFAAMVALVAAPPGEFLYFNF